MTHEKTYNAEEHLKQIRIEKIQKIKDMGENPYPPKYTPSHFAGLLQETYKSLLPEEETKDYVVVAGRVMSNRNSGMFIDLQDTTGKIQIFSHTDFLF